MLFGGTVLVPAASAQDPTAAAQVFASGLTQPVKLDTTRGGNLLVTETGSAANDGRLSMVDRFGNVQPLVSGFPSAIEVTGVPSGPTAINRRGCCVVELALGLGDTLVFHPNGPPVQVPNAVGSVAPIFSSVLKLVFDHPIDQSMGGFELTPADYPTLGDGFIVKLDNGAGESVRISLLAEIKDYRTYPIVNVRGSNPFSMARGGKAQGLIVADAGDNSLVQILSGPPKSVVRFAPIPNAPGVVPPVSDAVPTSVRHVGGNQFLVGLLTGVPFVPGSASIRLVDIQAGTQSELISGLTSVTDVLRVGSNIYVLEISSDLSLGTPGRLLRFSSPSSEPDVLATGLIGPTGMVHAPGQRAIFIAETFTGLIRRVDL